MLRLTKFKERKWWRLKKETPKTRTKKKKKITHTLARASTHTQNIRANVNGYNLYTKRKGKGISLTYHVAAVYFLLNVRVLSPLKYEWRPVNKWRHTCQPCSLKIHIKHYEYSKSKVTKILVLTNKERRLLRQKEINTVVLPGNSLCPWSILENIPPYS